MTPKLRPAARDTAGGPPGDVAGEPPGGGAETAGAVRRYLRHVQQLQGLRTRRAGSGRPLLIAGAVLVCAGISLVLLAWQGAANTPLVFEQIPYMISGGLLGVGLMVLGGLVYFGYWLSLLVRESRQERRQLIALLSSIDARLEGRPSPAASSDPEEEPAAADVTGEMAAVDAQSADPAPHQLNGKSTRGRRLNTRA